MEYIILEYLKVFWGWPIAAIIIFLLLKNHLRILMSVLERGLKLKIGNVDIDSYPLEFKEQTNERGKKEVTVSVESMAPSELTSFQKEILKKFISKGNYDSLNVSNNLIEDFRKLKLAGAFDWESEEAKERQVTLNYFIVTTKGKEMGA